MTEPDLSDWVLIEAPPVRGRNSVKDRKDREYVSTAWPQTETEAAHPDSLQAAPMRRRLIDRARLALARWIAPR